MYLLNTLHLKSLFTLLFVFSFQYVVAQDHPGTGGALCGSCTPTGWSLDAGSPDISSNDAWGFELLPSGAGTAWTNTIPPIPNGEVGFLTAHSTEVASMIISGLTVGVSYTLEFYYMTATVATPQAGYGGMLSPNIRYSIDGKPMVVKPIAVAETWYKELVVFTATATTSTFVFHGGSNDGVAPGNSATDGDLTSISFAPNGTVPSVPTCPTITVTAPFTSTICNGESVTLTATGPAELDYTYTWTDPSLTTVGTGKTLTVSPTDTISYKVTADSAGCSGNANSIVFVTPLPVVTVNSETICAGASVTLTASGADSYSWVPGNISGNPLTNTPLSTTTYTVTGTTAGCIGTAEAIATIGAGVSPDAGADITICTGATGTIGAIAVAGYSYSWAPTLDLSSSTTANPSVTKTNAGTSPSTTIFTLTAGPAGCEGTAEVIVTINPLDDASFSYSSGTVCKTGGVNPIPTISGISGGTYTGSAGLTINASTGEIDLSATAIGSYTVSYTTPGPCINSSDFNIAFVDVPAAGFNYAGPYCQSAPNATVSFSTGSSGGVFSSAAGLVFVSAASGEVDNAASTAGTYTVTNTIAAGGGCTATAATNTITINAAPVTIVDDASVCGGTPATLTASGADAYAWSGGTSAGTLTVSPSTTTQYTVTGTTAGCSSSAVGTVTANPNPVVTVTDDAICALATATLTASSDIPSTTYFWLPTIGAGTGATVSGSPGTTTTYTVTGTALGCTGTAVATITVNTAPVITTADAVVCDGEPTTLTATSDIPATTFVWSTNETTASIDVSPSVAETYTVVGTVAGGCNESALAVVTVNSKPIVSVNSPTVCGGVAATLTATSDIAATTFTWSTLGVSAAITVTPLVLTTYTVIGSTTAGCADTTTAEVQVKPMPTITVIGDSVCSGSVATLTASSDVVGTLFTWSSGVIGTGAIVTASPTAAATSYTVTGTANGCMNEASTQIVVNPLPVITVNDTIVCPGQTATLVAAGASSYIWSTGETTASIINGPGDYSVTGTAGGCLLTVSTRILAAPQPEAAFVFSPDPAGVLSPTISFTDQSSSDVNYWNWDFGDGDSVATNGQHPIHTYAAVEQSYTVTLNVQNAGLCTDTISRTIIIGPEYTFFVPNAFSPNDDKINDEFGPSGEGMLEYEFLIFDRWGEQLFYTTSIDTKWKGDYQGAPCQEDVYVWRAFVKDVFKKEHTYTGIVTLVK